MFLDFKSNHPEHCTKSIPYSQALRVIERCTSPEETKYHLSNLKNKFEDKSYPSKLVNEQFDRARKKDRKALVYQEREKEEEG